MNTNLKTFLLAIAAAITAVAAALVVYVNSFDPVEPPPDEPPPPPPVVLGTVPSFGLSTTHPDWPLYTTRVNSQVAGTFTEYSPTQMLAWWDADGRANNAVRDNAVTQFKAQLAASLAKWNANQELTEFSGGQYLYAVDRVRDWVLTLNWCGDQLTAQEKADAEMILARCIANMRGPTVAGQVQASWGTAAFNWPGWAQNNPANNYYYGHLESVILWALHSGSQEWADHLHNVMFPALTSHFAATGGGSLEGTYYGKSHRNLFRALWLWKEATGETVDVKAAEHIAYWIAATAPGYGHHVAIGDQAMSSMPRIYDANGDYLRAAILWGARLVDSPEARHWLAQDTHEHNRGNFWMLACNPILGTVTPASDATYHAAGVGHLFAKDSAGVMLSVAAGPLTESHDHHDQGEFQLYHGGQWRIASNNIWSTSGIRQGVADHCCLQFGAEQSSGACSLAYSDMNGVLTVNANLTPAYTQSVTRTVVWDRAAEKVTITDPTGGTFRCYVGTLPTVSGNVVTVGALTLTGASPVVADMEAIEPSGFNLGAAGPWRVEFASGVVEVAY